MCNPIVYLYYCYNFINLYVGFQLYYVCTFVFSYDTRNIYSLGLLASRTLTIKNFFWTCKVAMLVWH